MGLSFFLWIFQILSWVFATNSNFQNTLSLQPDAISLLCFKPRICDLSEFLDWNVKGLQERVAGTQGLKNKNLWQKLNSFRPDRLSRFGVYWTQTYKQTSKQTIYIYIFQFLTSHFLLKKNYTKHNVSRLSWRSSVVKILIFRKYLNIFIFI